MKIPLLGGAYSAQSLIAGAQECVNLYPEKNPETANFPYTHYQTPGLVTFVQGPSKQVRGLYTTTNGKTFAAIGDQLMRVNENQTLTTIGAISNLSSLVTMQDNSIDMVVVDGTDRGWIVDLQTEVFSEIDDPAWYGSTGIGYIDSFMVFNRPSTKQWYSTLSNQVVPLDGTYFAQKTVSPDLLKTIMVRDRSIILFGANSLEFWYNAGGTAFPFQIQPGAFENIGIEATKSLSQVIGTAFWLSNNDQGRAVAVKCTEYQVERISNYAVEQEWAGYSRVDDAIGYVYQSRGHVFYVLTFPTADRTWAFDMVENAWHRRAWLDPNDGVLRRHRGNCYTFAFGKHLVGDFENGKIYWLNDNANTDDGNAIRRIRSFPTISAENKRVSYLRFLADMEVGESANTVQGQGPKVELRWSDTYGRSWGVPVMQSLGATGDFQTSMVWNRLGMGRNRVFELAWSADVKTALNGAFIEVAGGAT